MIMPSVQGKPAAIQELFVPCAEVHRRRIDRYSDVTKVTRAIPRRDVHASRQGHCKMREVPTNAPALLVPRGSDAIAARVMIGEFDSVVSVVANRLRTFPSSANTSKERPR